MSCTIAPAVSRPGKQTMAEEAVLPSLVVKTAKSEFRLRCHAAAWAGEYGGTMKTHRRHSREYPGLLLLSATGPDTAVKSVRATLYQPALEAEFTLDMSGTVEHLLRARSDFDGRPVSYTAAVAKLAPGVVHLVALARIPGLMPNLSDDHLWSELSGPSYTTPLLRRWTAWLKAAMVENGGIIVANGFAANVGVLKTEPEALDELVSQGVRDGRLAMCG
jgi:hypothetical protein